MFGSIAFSNWSYNHVHPTSCLAPFKNYQLELFHKQFLDRMENAAIIVVLYYLPLKTVDVKHCVLYEPLHGCTRSIDTMLFYKVYLSKSFESIVVQT